MNYLWILTPLLLFRPSVRFLGHARWATGRSLWLHWGPSYPTSLQQGAENHAQLLKIRAESRRRTPSYSRIYYESALRVPSIGGDLIRWEIPHWFCWRTSFSSFPTYISRNQSFGAVRTPGTSLLARRTSLQSWLLHLPLSNRYQAARLTADVLLSSSSVWAFQPHPLPGIVGSCGENSASAACSVAVVNAAFLLSTLLSFGGNPRRWTSISLANFFPQLRVRRQSSPVKG